MPIFDLDGCLVASEPYLLEAVAAGMRTVGFVGRSHLDSIREQHKERLLAAGAEAALTDLADLTAQIWQQK